jgi:iron complex transport system permease protein
VRATDVSPARVSWTWWAAAAASLGVAVLAGVALGPASLRLSAILNDVLQTVFPVDAPVLDETQHAILWQLRVPRVVLAGLVGAMLSIAGASYQGVFRNPLADPYLLGVAAGAGLGATIVIVFGSLEGAPLLLPAAAFVGALSAVVLTYVLGTSVSGTSTTATLIVAGVAIAAFFTAAQTFVQQRNAEALRQIYTWILGRLGTNGWDEVLLVLPYVVVSSVVLLIYGRSLDVMSVGDAEARVLGVRVSRVRLIVVVFATLGTAAAVAVSGLIAFVGIIVPHTVRLMVGTAYRSLLPLSLLFGASFLIIADLLARTLAAPAELPIGVITAFVGAPFFAVVLRTSRGSIG